MRGLGWLVVTALLCAGQLPARAQEVTADSTMEARIWLDRGDDPLVQRGDRVRVYYRTSHDSYVAIFHIDTDGSATLVQPGAPDEDHYIRGGRDYRLLFPRSPYWNVDEDPGVGYYFMVASPEPFDFSGFTYAPRERGWDLADVGRVVYEDPYVAMDDYVAALIPDWEYVPYTLDFLSYSVGAQHDYPRFMCYQCHSARSYADWNPYDYACTQFRVVIWDDPYFYPSYRYDGIRVVYTVPLRARPRYGFTARYAGQPWAPVVRHRPAPQVTATSYKEAPTRQPSAVPSTERRPNTGQALPSGVLARPTRASVPGAPPALGATRRTDDAAPSARVLPTTGDKQRPTLQRRPTGTTGGAARTRSGTGETGTGETGIRVPSNRPSRVLPSTGGGTSRPSASGRTTPTTRSPVTRPSSTQPSTSRPPAVRPNSGSSRPTTSRPAASRPPSRPQTSRPRPAVRPRGGGSSSGSASPPPRRGGGSGSASPPPRRGGGGGSASPPPRRGGGR